MAQDKAWLRNIIENGNRVACGIGKLNDSQESVFNKLCSFIDFKTLEDSRSDGKSNASMLKNFSSWFLQKKTMNDLDGDSFNENLLKEFAKKQCPGDMPAQSKVKSKLRTSLGLKIPSKTLEINAARNLPEPYSTVEEVIGGATQVLAGLREKASEDHSEMEISDDDRSASSPAQDTGNQQTGIMESIHGERQPKRESLSTTAAEIYDQANARLQATLDKKPNLISSATTKLILEALSSRTKHQFTSPPRIEQLKILVDLSPSQKEHPSTQGRS